MVIGLTRGFDRHQSSGAGGRHRCGTRRSPALAVGNIVGANLVNLLFILGLAALLVPVAFERRSLRFDVPAMVVALVIYELARDGVLGPADGILLMLGGVIYTAGILHVGRRDPDAVAAGPREGRPNGRPPSFASSSSS